MIVGAILFIFLLIKVPVQGVYKITSGTFSVFKWLVLLVAVPAFIKTKPT